MKSLRLRRLALGLSLFAVPTAELSAQVRFDRASLVIPVSLTIGPRLLLVSAGAPAVAAKTPAGTELELPFTVAANVAWSITVGLPVGAEARDPVQVLDDRGRWRSLTPGGSVRVVSRRDPSEPTILKVRVRLPSNSKPGLTDTFRFAIEAAEGARVN